MKPPHGNARPPKIARLVWAGVLAIALMVFAGVAAARKKPEPVRPSDGLANHVNSLVRRLYGLHLDQFEPLSGEIQKLVVGHLDAWAAGRAPNFVEVREQLENMFSKVRYPLIAEPTVFQATWKGRRLILAGYTVGWGDVDLVNTVVVYESRGGHTRQAALTHFLPRADLQYDLVPEDQEGNFRFIIWGNQMGMDHPRLSAILYSFDGEHLKSLWQDQGVYDGRLEVNGSEVVIQYLNHDEYVRALQQNTLPSRHEATYRLTAEGLNLEGIRDIPF